MPKKKVSLTINGSRYDIQLEKDFANYLLDSMEKDFNTEGNNDAKTLLHAYVRMSSEQFKLENEITHLLEKVDDKLR